MTTTQITSEIIEFDAPVNMRPTDEWIARDYAGFRIARQAGRGTGVWCSLYVRMNGQLVKAGETLKHLKIDDDGAWLTFGRRYSVAA